VLTLKFVAFCVGFSGGKEGPRITPIKRIGTLIRVIRVIRGLFLPLCFKMSLDCGFAALGLLRLGPFSGCIGGIHF
jgi:hypothetical protein